MTHEEMLPIASQIPGMMWPRELTWLYNNFAASRMHAEIGTYCGRSLFASAAAMRSGARIIAVDSVKLTPAPPEWIKGVLSLTFNMLPEGVSASHWKMLSLAAATKAMQEGLQFDSVFIDGDHRRVAVEADICAWQPLIRPGGILAGHDYWPRDAGVMEAVNRNLPNFRVAPDTRIWWARVNNS